MKKQITDELKQYHVVSNWWNRGKKSVDYNGNLTGMLEHNNISVTKIKDKKHPELNCYVFKSRSRITYKHFGDLFEGAFSMLKMVYAYRGYKVTVNVIGREFTINH